MNKKIFLSMILLSSLSVFAEDASRNEFGASSDDKSFIEETEFTKESYSRGTYYNANIGNKSLTKEIDTEFGTVNLKDSLGNIIKFGLNDNNHTEGYSNALNEVIFRTAPDGSQVFRDGLNENDPNSAFNQLSDSEKDTARNAYRRKIDNAKSQRAIEMDNKGHNQANREESFLKGMSPNGKGQKSVNLLLNGEEVMRDRYGNVVHDDTNVTEYYRNNFGYAPELNSRDRLSESKADVLVQAYNQVDAMKSLIKSQIDSTEIQCFIARDLIEAYYCPMSDRNTILFPDYLNGGASTDDAQHYSSQFSKDSCNKSCKESQSCKDLEVQSELSKSFSSFNNKKIYPSMDVSNGEFILNVSKKVQTESVSFDLVVVPSEDFDGNDTAFDKFLYEAGDALKVNLTLVKKPTDSSILSEAISANEKRIIKHSTINITIPIFRQSDRFILKLYNPYMYPVGTPTNKRIGETEFFKNIAAIQIKNVKVKYRNNKVFFCPSRQIIYDARECSSNSILHINQGSQIFDVCLDNDHKIGDDMITGGFFDEGSCESSCYETQDCLATYRHYSDLSKSKIFKTSIGCVDSESNIGCQDQFCEALFSDPTIDPVNEITINSNEERVYTIKNFLATDIPRPKIDSGGEESATTESDFDALFQREMKDNAYKAMLDKQTFTRIKYKIGEVSPEQVAFKAEVGETGTKIKGLVKFASDRFDNASNYQVFSVVELETQYRLRYGQFIIQNPNGIGNTVLNASDTSVMVSERTYLINDGGSWKIFKKIYKDKLKQNKNTKVCPDNAGGVTDSKTGALSNRDKNSGCYINNRVEWTELSNYRKQSFVKYGSSGKLIRFSGGQTAPYIKEEEVESNSEIKEYDLTSSFEHMVRDTPGALIRDQETNDDGRTTTEIYNMGTPLNGLNMSQILNYKVYLFTSERDISYQNILAYKLTDKNLIFDKSNQRHAKRKIYDDGEINNGVKAYVLGKPRETSVIMDIKPKFGEEGKRVFQFMFLYNERDTIHSRLD